MDEKKRKKVEKKAARRFRIILVPNEEGDGLAGSGGDAPDYILGVGTESESGSVLGSSSDRGMGGQELDGVRVGAGAGPGASSHNYQETLPPAYWDANAVDGFNDMLPPQQQQQQGLIESGLSQSQSQNGLPMNQHQQQISTEADVVAPFQPVPPPAAPDAKAGKENGSDAPVEREIQYTRSGGYTNT